MFALTLFIQAVAVRAAAGKATPSEARAEDHSRVDFARDIEPIFTSRCHSCHGDKESKNGLRLDRRTEALRGGDSGLVIIPGKSSESLLIHYVTGESESKTVMPAKGERLSAEQIKLLRDWIDDGADWPLRAEPALVAQPEHWAFRPPIRPAVPTVRHATWVRNPVDAFIAERFERENIEPSSEADRATLIRRLSLDLLGLLPTPQEVEAFVRDSDPAAYERVVDRLLASPHFGERWARYWLDLARYADSDGYEDDKFRPDAWRYRDWVITVINSDLPFNQFTIWQIAGDLLPEATYEQKLASGFHRMTLSNNAGAGGIKEEYRVKTVKDRLSTTGTAWLGLTIGCAECHSHKYDPISLREYYQLYAFFNNTEEITTPAPKLSERYQREYDDAVRAFEERLKAVRNALDDYEKSVQPNKQQQWEQQAAQDQSVPAEIRAVLSVAVDQRTSQQKNELVKYFRSIDPEHARLKAVVPVGDEVGNNRPLAPSEKALVIGESTELRKSFLMRKGDFLKPGTEVQPATPEFLAPLVPRGSTPDRLDLARWIADPANPLTRRVAVNYIWQGLFGQGLVTTPDNFGVKGERPTHPELLDWLACEFSARGWSRKEMIRLIVSSATYRQSSRTRPDLLERDPNNALLARQNRLRAEAECVRDLALSASGLLNGEIGGPSFQPPLPVALTGSKELKNERFMETSPASHRYRRGVYINVQRTFLFPMLKTFDVADANVCVVRRERSNTPLQALTLLNDPVFVEAAQALGQQVVREIPSDEFAPRLRHLYRLCLAREPEESEVTALRKLFAEQTKLSQAVRPPVVAAENTGNSFTGSANLELSAWTGVARTILNSDEFITRE